MLFSLKRVLLPAIGALALLQSTVAYPLLSVERNGLIERSEASENALFDREFIDLQLPEARDDLVDNSLLEREWLDRRAPPLRKALPNYTKLRLSDDARGELDKMGLHGKARKNTIKWHKNQVKKEMKTNPTLKDKARTGVIQHLAHKGGSDPKEKNHITASFRDKHNQPVPNKFNGGNNHHLYVKNNNQGLPGQAKAGWNKNNADIRGNSKSHQASLSKTRTPGKSSDKGKGKQNPENNFSKNPNKGFQRKGGR